jgi:hypothetical protein
MNSKDPSGMAFVEASRPLVEKPAAAGRNHAIPT